MASTYMAYAFRSGSPKLEESFVSMLNGSAYSEGNRVVQSRMLEYADQRWIMLIHTTCSAMALLVGILQIFARHRTSRRTHTRLGRVFVVAVSIGMAAGLVFTAQSPAIRFEGGYAFRLQLAELGIITLASAWAGAYFAIRGKSAAHRACMGLAIAFLMTAPLLRFGWATLGPLIPSFDLLQSLAASSVALAVIAPAAGCIAFMSAASLTHTPRYPVAHASRGVYLTLATVGVAGFATIWILWNSVAGHRLAPYPWFHIVPGLIYLVWCFAAGRRARQRGDRQGEVEWTWLAVGAASVPLWTVVNSWLANFFTTGLSAVLIALMTAPGGPVLLSLCAVVARRESSTAEGRERSLAAVEQGLRWLA